MALQAWQPLFPKGSSQSPRKGPGPIWDRRPLCTIICPGAVLTNQAGDLAGLVGTGSGGPQARSTEGGAREEAHLPLCLNENQ